MVPSLHSLALATVLALASVVNATSASDSWPQWRGPHRDGFVSSTTPWPTKLDGSSLTRRWRVPLGPSYSGPLISSNRVFVTEAQNQSKEVVIALDRATGTELWRHTWEGYLKVPFFAKSNGDWIRSTPALANGRLYVGGMRDVLVCLDAESGNELWKYDFPQQLGKPLPDFGFVCSPLVADGAVYVQAGGGFAKLDALQGKLLWSTLDDGGGMWGSAFSSPVLVTLSGQPQLVVQTRDKLAGVHPESGKVLWEQSIKAFRGMNILTPVIVGDRILTAAYGGQTQAWSVSRNGEAWSVREAWHLKAEGYMSTPVVIDGHAYLHSRSQRILCIDVATGKKRWESDQKFGKYMSFVAHRNSILALDERGVLYLLDADHEGLRIVSELKTSESDTWAHLAIVGNDIAIRELDGLALWSWSSPGPGIASP